MSQSDVASIMYVTKDTVYKWEANLFPPMPKHMKNIIAFLGYDPMEKCSQALHVQLRAARLRSGETINEAALRIGCCPATLSKIEKNTLKPRPITWAKIEKYINSQKI